MAAHPDYDELLLPMLARLVKNVRMHPDPEELDYLKGLKDVKDLAKVFEAGTQCSEKELYFQILEPVHAKRKAKAEAEAAEKRRIEEEKKKAEEKAAQEKKRKEEEEARQKAKEEYERKRKENPTHVDYDQELVPLLARLVKNIKANPDEEELKFLKGIHDVKDLARIFDSASGRSEKELYEHILEPLHSKRRAKADAEAAELKRQKAEKEAAEAEAKRKEEEEHFEREQAKKWPGKCLHCKKWIEEKDYLENEGTYLHHGCLDAYQASQAKPCTQCGKPVLGEYVEMIAAVTKKEAHLHPDCVIEWKKATRPHCKKCKEQIMETITALGADYYHPPCCPA